ncbi:MAG: ATP-binding protein, partial [Gammaproteobacteria bacterium]|nr:ATP-binding protein [Gammaproteobacteria bacterium]
MEVRKRMRGVEVHNLGEFEGMSGTEIPIMDLFRTEVSKQCTIISEILLNAQHAELESTALEELLRAAHSLKGAARLVNAMAIVHVAHALEEGLLKLSTEQRPPDLWLQVFLQQLEWIMELSLKNVHTMSEWNRQSASRLQTLQDQLARPEANIPFNARARQIGVGRSVAHYLSITKPLQFKHADNLLGLATEALMTKYKENHVLDTLWEMKAKHQLILSEIEELVSTLKQSPDLLMNAVKIKERVLLLREEFHDGLLELQDLSRQNNRTISDFHQEVLSHQLRPFSDSVRLLPNLIEDLSKQLGKQVELKVIDNGVVLDRELVASIEFMLLHIVQNAIDHGIENEEGRRRSNKANTGTIQITANSFNGDLRIRVSDDGAGIDVQTLCEKAVSSGLLRQDVIDRGDQSLLQNLIFLPGISTSADSSFVSGRGVGLDVVQSTIQSLGGSVSVRSEQGKGTAFEFRIPQGLVRRNITFVRSGFYIYGFPEESVIHQSELSLEQVVNDEDGQKLPLGDQLVPLVDLSLALERKNELGYRNESLRVIFVHYDKKTYALLLDEFLPTESVVVQRIGPDYAAKQYLGSSLLENRNTGLIVNVAAVFQNIALRMKKGEFLGVEVKSPELENSFSALVIDESTISRELQSRIIRSRGGSVQAVSTLEEAKREVAKKEYDFI